MANKIDVRKPNFAYLLGFIQTDGTLGESTRQRGKMRIELNERDRDILDKFSELIPYNSSVTTRERDTTFKEGYRSAILTVSSLDFRNELINLGMSYGKKSDDICPMPNQCSINDYFRGVIDGDGSLGLTKDGFPFLSLVTKSETLKEEYLSFVQSITGKIKNVNRNKRDNVYNIVVYKEDAQEVVKALGYEDGLCLNRKKEKAKEVLEWVRPDDMKKVVNKRGWTSEEDEYILTHSISEAVEYLKRSESSVKTRKWRLSSR